MDTLWVLPEIIEEDYVNMSAETKQKNLDIRIKIYNYVIRNKGKNSQISDDFHLTILDI
jgi:hypothetical protein